jgi:hypothetical protein
MAPGSAVIAVLAAEFLCYCHTFLSGPRFSPARVALSFPRFSVIPAFFCHSCVFLSFLCFSVLLSFSVFPVFFCLSCLFLFFLSFSVFPVFFCHSRAGGNPSWDLNTWIPACALMTSNGKGKHTAGNTSSGRAEQQTLPPQPQYPAPIASDGWPRQTALTAFYPITPHRRLPGRVMASGFAVIEGYMAIAVLAAEFLCYPHTFLSCPHFSVIPAQAGIHLGI